MKLIFQIIGFLTFLHGVSVSAQVNLDQPLMKGSSLGAADKIYRSSADPNIGYIFPIALESLTVPEIREVDREYRLRFNVGINPQEVQTSFQQMAAAYGPEAPGSIQVMRGYNAKLDPAGSTDISRKYRARLIPLSDPGNIGGPTAYVLSIRKSPRTKKLLKAMFNGKSAGHLGTLSYDFNAVAGGKQFFSQTAVSIWAATEVENFPRQGFSSTGCVFRLRRPAVSVRFRPAIGA